MGLTHFDEANSNAFEVGHIRGTWSYLGESAGCRTVGVRRIQLPEGAWSTPAHEHGREEEIFYVLAGRGISWQRGKTAEVSAGDCIVYLPRRGAHTIHALEGGIDLLAFGPREYDESVRFPRLGMSLVGSRFVESVPGSLDGVPLQFVRESELGAPELPAEPGVRPQTIVNIANVEAEPVDRPRVAGIWRDLGAAVGSRSTGLQHVAVAPGKLGCPRHCHSLEEEIFVMLDGDGIALIGDEEVPVRSGHVIARPAATGKAHAFRGGTAGLTYLAYGPRFPNDICYYPDSNKILFGGVGLVARLEPLDYWDGED
ncbi:MAG TPA: cupin domain-containing protein [Solirubrobacteraceae bacterium]|jgi:uncharacterized cupin superfamily protein|nr:cupin domain-containing protein [Solirubrobacteraceae bacterium]